MDVRELSHFEWKSVAVRDGDGQWFYEIAQDEIAKKRAMGLIVTVQKRIGESLLFELLARLTRHGELVLHGKKIEAAA